MRRRNLLLGLLAGPLLAETVTIDASQKLSDTYNTFAEAVNEWIHIRHDAPKGTYSWPAKRHWDREVRPAWKAIDLAVKNE